MITTNFSKNAQEAFDLFADLAHNDYSRHVDSSVSRRDLENTLRDKIKNDLLGGLTFYQALRRNKLEAFEIMEQMVNMTLGEDIMESEFVDSFVEIKNRKLDDKTAWYSEGGLLTVATFAGNHWDTARQRLDIGEEFTLPAEWYFIHVYDEFERFVTGAISLDRLMDKITKSINKYVQDRMYAQFTNVANAIPQDFVKSGNDEVALGNLCDVVAAAGGYSSLTIAGTKGALRKLVNAVPDAQITTKQKEDKQISGAIKEWEGNRLLCIPQTLKSGTFETALDNSKLFIFGADCKPIKMDIYGDTRTREVADNRVMNDMTYDIQLQTKIGMGLIVPPACGIFTWQS